MARSNASVQRFIKLMRTLPAQVAVDTDAALQQCAASMVSQIKDAAPVGASGRLRDSVKYSKKSRPLAYLISAGGPKTRPGSGTFVGEFRDALSKSSRGKAAGLGGMGLYDYARAIEFGTARGTKATGFFFKTFNRNKKAMKRTVAAATRKALKDYFDNA